MSRETVVPLALEALPWEPRVPDEPAIGFIAWVRLGSQDFHVEARPVHVTEGGLQEAVHPSVEEELDGLRAVNDAFGHYETVAVNGFDCVITFTPFCS